MPVIVKKHNSKTENFRDQHSQGVLIEIIRETVKLMSRGEVNNVNECKHQHEEQNDGSTGCQVHQDAAVQATLKQDGGSCSGRLQLLLK